MEEKKNKFLIKSYKQMFLVIGIFTLVLFVGGTTFAFFNYTRTGVANNIKTGRIYFNSTQNGTLNMTNIFPLTSTQASTAILDSVTVGIVGDTTYADGEEFEITLVDVINTINGKKIPINYTATYEAVSGKSIGTESDDYWNARNSKNADIYTLTETGKVEDGKQVLVGYIKNSASGIEGTLTIKAYIDADRIAISDTYPESVERYILNNNMTTEELNACVSYTQSQDWNFDIGGAEGFCNGTGTMMYERCPSIDPFCKKPYTYISTFQERLNRNDFLSSDLEYFEDHNIIEYINYANGTTSNWVDGRVVFTTEEWNSFQNSSTPISFKIKAESNEGIWVEEPSKGIESCPDCKFIYTTNIYNYGTSGSTISDITANNDRLYDNYNDVITSSRKFFLGFKIENDRVLKAYACGIKGESPNEGIPFCIEGSVDGSTYIQNATILNDSTSGIWQNGCDIGDPINPENNHNIYCHGLVNANATEEGQVVVGDADANNDYIVDLDNACYVGYYGDMMCADN